MRRRTAAGAGGRARRPVRRVGPATERDRERAAIKLQGLYRAKMAMRRLRVLTRQVYEKVQDPETGAFFYHNTHTGEVAWTQPKLLGAEDFDVIEDDKVSPHDKVTTYRRMAKEWTVHVDEGSGATYFYNASSQETTWEKPSALAKLDAAVEERDEMLGPDWTEVQDEHLNYFFYNSKTNESEWEPPNVDFRVSKEEKARLAKEAAREAEVAERKAQKAAAQAAKLAKRMEAGKKDKPLEDKGASGEVAAQGSDSSDVDGDSSSDSDDDSEPPEALAVGEGGAVEDRTAALLGGDSTDDDSVFISSEEEVDEAPREYTAREKKLLKRRRQRRDTQQQRHLANLNRLVLANDKERRAYAARVAMKRCRKRQAPALNLCDMELEAVPQEVVTDPRLFKRLVRLDLGFNQLQRVPRMVKRLASSLEEMVLDSNRLVHLPVQLWYCTKLAALDLRNNRLREIPREKGNMQVLRDTSLWEIGIENLQALRVLRLDRNDLDLIPQHVCELTALEHLSARANRITAVPERGLERLERLRHLDLSENCLEALPAKGLGALVALELLSVAHNALGALPDDLGGAAALAVLRAGNNRLKQLPLSFSALERLELLNVEHNALTELPANWGRMASSLRSVNAAHNQIASLSASFASLSSLVHLDLSHNAIKPRLPAGIGGMGNLRSLDVSHNQLDHVGFDDWSGLTSLVLVNLSHNCLRAADSGFAFACPQLQACDLSHNKLTEVGRPERPALASPSLKELNLSCNEITRLPKELFSKTCLRKLDLSSNRVTSLPAEVGCLDDSLEWLNMDRNRLRALPDALADLRRLRFISLCHNQLTRRPVVLERVQGLLSWQLSDNPIKQTESREAWRQRLLAEAGVLLANGKVQDGLRRYDDVYADLLGEGGTGGYKGDSLDTDDESDRGQDSEGELGGAETKKAGGGEDDGEGGRASSHERAERKRVPLPSVVSLRDPVVREERKLLEEILRKRGTALLSVERYDEALADINDALALLDKPTSDLLFYRGVVLSRGLNDPTGALADLDRAVAINPSYVPGFRQRSACLIDLGHYDKALADACVVLEFDMFDAEAFFLKGLALEKLQKLEDALAAYKQAIDLCMGKGRQESQRSGVSSPPADKNGDDGDSGEQGANPTAAEEATSSGGDGGERATARRGSKAGKSPGAEEPKKLSEVLSDISPWSPLGTAYYRCGLIKRDLDKAPEAVAQFQTASDVLYLQYDKAAQGSLRKKALAETLKLSVMSRSSALQTMNRGKKAIAAYVEAIELDQRLE